MATRSRKKPSSQPWRTFRSPTHLAKPRRRSRRRRQWYRGGQGSEDRQAGCRRRGVGPGLSPGSGFPGGGICTRNDIAQRYSRSVVRPSACSGGDRSWPRRPGQDHDHVGLSLASAARIAPDHRQLAVDRHRLVHGRTRWRLRTRGLRRGQRCSDATVVKRIQVMATRRRHPSLGGSVTSTNFRSVTGWTNSSSGDENFDYGAPDPSSATRPDGSPCRVLRCGHSRRGRETSPAIPATSRAGPSGTTRAGSTRSTRARCSTTSTPPAGERQRGVPHRQWQSLCVRDPRLRSATTNSGTRIVTAVFNNLVAWKLTAAHTVTNKITGVVLTRPAARSRKPGSSVKRPARFRTWRFFTGPDGRFGGQVPEPRDGLRHRPVVRLGDGRGRRARHPSSCASLEDRAANGGRHSPLVAEGARACWPLAPSPRSSCGAARTLTARRVRSLTDTKTSLPWELAKESDGQRTGELQRASTSGRSFRRARSGPAMRCRPFSMRREARRYSPT